MNISKFSAITETKSVSTIVSECKSKHFNLNPPYQRGMVWSEKDKQGYIDSIYRGIVPNPIIINVEENGTLTCIDGKQRLTALKEYIENKFCFEYYDDDNCVGIYYKKINDPVHQDNPGYRILSTSDNNNELAYFDNRSIPIVKYTHLTYADQIDIFNRIQNGKRLIPSELIMSIFSTDKMSAIYQKFVEEHKDMIFPYVKRDKQRSGVTLLLTNIFFLLANKKLCRNKIEREGFIKRFRNMTELNGKIKIVSPTIELYFSKKFLNNSKYFTNKKIICISEKMLQNTILLCQKFCPVDNDNIDDIRKIVINSLNEYINAYTLQKKKKKNESAYNTILEIKLREYCSENEKCSDNDDDTKDGEEEEDTEDIENTDTTESSDDDVVYNVKILPNGKKQITKTKNTSKKNISKNTAKNTAKKDQSYKVYK